MKPIKFKEHNTVYAEGQDEYGNLPVFKDEKGEIVSCWKLSFRERLIILFSGKIWMSLLTFNRGLPPSFLTTKKKDIFE